ncbi:rho GTPase-activating protein 27 isoform X1 [Anas platyrhynchos]|uniref:rho GTPase-activating protein 27 isoform X1 n=3 Tax=Anas platyrhynchos TaxID=8839 RepID=UPI003AF274F5
MAGGPPEGLGAAKMPRGGWGGAVSPIPAPSPAGRGAGPAMESAGAPEEVYVLVEYGFEYRAKDGTLVSIKPNERYVLLKRTNDHWWHVRKSRDARPFYIPAQYVKELPPIASPAPLYHEEPEPEPEPPAAYEYRFIGAAPTARGDLPPTLSSFRAAPAPSPHPAEPMRPTQSLDDLPRVTPVPHGATTMGPHGDPPARPRPLSKSRSETLCVPSKDTDTARQPRSSHIAQVRKEPEEPPAHVYLNIQELQEEAATGSSAPPAPEEPCGSRTDWETHMDTDSGHLFYYNPVTGETTWDCPFEQAEDGVSPAASPASSLAHSPQFAEWGQYVDEASGQAFFYNSVTGETSWDPPHTGDSSQDMYPGLTPCSPMEQRPPTPEADYPDLSPDELEGYPEEDYSPLGSYEQGAAHYLPPRYPEELGSSPGWYGHSHPEGAPGYPEHFGTETVPAGSRQHRASSSSSQDSGLLAWPSCTPAALGLKEEKFKSLDKAGVLNRTKIADRGKRLRKNWSSSWTVLEGGILTFFKDSKHSSAGALRHPGNLTMPEHTVELRGATVTWASKDKSSKKHVLELRTREGSEFLIQHDSEQIIATWQKAIADSIARLGTDLPAEEDAESGTEFGSREKLGSSEERRASASGQAAGTAESDSSKVRNKLRKFLQRRPTLQSLRERGYIKDQVFGCSLQVLCERERGTVPRFVQQCIQTVERRGLDIDGLYRVSGNLATIQKLRYKVDHDEHLDLDDGRWEDIHVITGALKLFFRELPEPLVPFSHFDKFIAAIKMQEPARRGRCIRDLVYSLPPANHDTMMFLFRHLCRVIEYKEENRMSVQSVAIVFGPTLLRPASEESNMAMHMVFQNQVVEHILNQYSYIFPDG